MRTYTDDATRSYESSIRGIAQKAMRGAPPFSGPLSLSIRIRLQVPASYSKRRQARILAGDEPYLGNIDWDNGAKSCADAMNGVVFVDDRQIVRAFVVKEAHTNPGLDIRVECLAPQNRPGISTLSAAAGSELPQIVSPTRRGVVCLPGVDEGQAALS